MCAAAVPITQAADDMDWSLDDSEESSGDVVHQDFSGSEEEEEDEATLASLIHANNIEELQHSLDDEAFTLRNLEEEAYSTIQIYLDNDCPIVFRAAYTYDPHILRIILQMIERCGLQEYRAKIEEDPEWNDYILDRIEDPLMLYLLDAYGFIQMPEQDENARAEFLKKVLISIFELHTFFLEDYVMEQIQKGRSMSASRIKTMDANYHERLAKIHENAEYLSKVENFDTLFHQRKKSYLQSGNRYHIQTLDFLQTHVFWLFTEIGFPELMDQVLQYFVGLAMNGNHSLYYATHREQGVYEPVTFQLYMEYLMEWMMGWRHNVHSLLNVKKLTLSDPRIIMAFSNLMWLEEVLMDDYQAVFRSVYRGWSDRAQYPQDVIALLAESRMDRSCHAFQNNPHGWLLSKNYHVAFEILRNISKSELERVLTHLLQSGMLFDELFFASGNPFASLFYRDESKLAMPWYEGEFSYVEDLDLGKAAKFIALFIHLVDIGEIKLTGCNADRNAYAWLLDWLFNFFQRKGFMPLMKSSTQDDTDSFPGGGRLALLNGNSCELGSPLSVQPYLLLQRLLDPQVQRDSCLSI